MQMRNSCFENDAGLVSTPSINEKHKDITKKPSNDIAATLLSKHTRRKRIFQSRNFV